jgi:hypothetical protein
MTGSTQHHQGRVVSLASHALAVLRGTGVTPADARALAAGIAPRAGAEELVTSALRAGWHSVEHQPVEAVEESDR